MVAVTAKDSSIECSCKVSFPQLSAVCLLGDPCQPAFIFVCLLVCLDCAATSCVHATEASCQRCLPLCERQQVSATRRTTHCKHLSSPASSVGFGVSGKGARGRGGAGGRSLFLKELGTASMWVCANRGSICRIDRPCSLYPMPSEHHSRLKPSTGCRPYPRVSQTLVCI